MNLDRYELARDNILRDHIKRKESHFLNEFENNYGRSTTLLPLSKKRFHLPIDNALFDVYVNKSEVVKKLEYTVVYEAKVNLATLPCTLCFGKTLIGLLFSLPSVTCQSL